MTTRLLLMRHGQTAWNASRRLQGHAPVPLDDVGIQQARLAADYLMNAGINHIYSSDLSRTRMTAEIVANVLKLPVSLDARLREVDVGLWQGLTGHEIELWDSETLAAVRANPLTTPRPGGESQTDLGTRGVAALEDYVQQYPDAFVLAVSHGGTIRGILQMLGLWEDHLSNLPSPRLANTSLTTLEYSENRWKLVSFGETPHFDGE